MGHVAVPAKRNATSGRAEIIKIAAEPQPTTGYTKAQKARVRRLYLGGKSAPEIARRLGRTTAAIAHLVRKLKLKSPKIVTDKQKRIIRRMFKAGKLVREIAAEIGRTEKSVNRQLSKMKLKSAKRYTRKDIKLIRKLSAEGKSFPEIAKELKRPLPGLEKKMAELGIFRTRYTKAEIRIVRSMHRKGFNAVQIAAALPGRDATSVRGKLNRMGFVSEKAKAWVKKAVARRMTDAQHARFCEFLKLCANGGQPIPLFEIMLLWNRDAPSRNMPLVGVDKTEYWLRKLGLPVITGKDVKTTSPKAHARRVRAKLKTLHKKLEERDAKKLEDLRVVRFSLLRKRHRPEMEFCPRCDCDEGPWPVTPVFFYHRPNVEGDPSPQLDSCILCKKRRRRMLTALRASGAAPEELAEWKRKDNHRTLTRRRELGISRKGFRA